MLSSLKNHDPIYLLCLSTEAKQLFQISLETLLESANSDYMVYKLQDKSLMKKSDYSEWSEVLEIDESNYSSLHLNLCHKIGKEVRRKSNQK